MSALSDFTNVLVKDSRIAGITDQLTYAVQSGASSNTYQSFNAVSKSNSQLSFNIQVPSENIIVNREVLLRATIDFTMEVKVDGVNVPAVNFCGTDALSPFPLNSLFTTASAQINNTNVSSNIGDILPIILQLADQRELSTYNDMCPSLLDTFYAKFADTFISGVGNSGISVASGGGATAGVASTTTASAVFPPSATGSLYQLPAHNSPLAGFNHQSLDNAFRPRGAFPLKVISIRRSTSTAVTGSAFSVADADVFYVALRAEVIEPIIGLSPFTYGNNQFNKAGLVGINNMNFVFNIDSTLSRLMCNAVLEDTATTQTYYKKLVPGHTSDSGVTGSAITADLFSRAELLVNFLSSQPTDLIPARNVVPFVDLPRFITQASNKIATATTNITPGTEMGLISGSATTFVSQGIQLNQLPDYFIIALRSKGGTKLYNNTSGHPQEFAPHFLPITGISINLNNTSGLLSSATQADLYRISCANHSKQTWDAFRGKARVYSCAVPAITTAANIASLALTSTGHMGYAEVATIGSVLVLNPAYDLSIPDYLSSGSLGAYNFQFSVTCENYNLYESTPDIVVICANSGVFSTIAGSSNIYTGILTKSMVLDAKKESAESPIMSSQFERSVGGAMMPNNAMSGEMPLIKEFKANIGKTRVASMGSGVSSGGGRFSHLTR
jgi:hypothetical protein